MDQSNSISTNLEILTSILTHLSQVTNLHEEEISKNISVEELSGTYLRVWWCTDYIVENNRYDSKS